MNWLSKDKRLIWHPYTQQKTAPDPLFIQSARGAWLYGEDGRRILDAVSSWWVTLHGHAHPHIAERLAQQALQLEQVIFSGFTHQPAIELAEKLLPLLPGDFSRIFYSDNGSTATEVALKMAIQYWWNTGSGKEKPRHKILAFENAYHGDTFGAMSVSGRSVFTQPFNDQLFDVLFIPVPTEENLPGTLALLEDVGTELAGFIYEPLLQGAGGMLIYEAAPMNRLLAAVKAQGILCIADEVLTGFGRTGTLFASEQLEVIPDIICLSKGLTGGTLALGVTACTAEIFDAYWSDDRRKTLFHGHSFTANPLACTAALASLELFAIENTMDRVASISSWNRHLADRWRNKYATGSGISGIRQQGTLFAFDIVSEQPGYLNQIGPQITRLALDNNIYLRPLGNTVYFLPPFCLTGDEHALLAEITGQIVKMILHD